MFKQKLKDDLMQSLLAKDEVKKSTLRLLLSAIGYYEIQKGLPRRVKAGGAGYEANDEDVLAVLQKEAKQHRDSIDQFANANREELVEKEKKELEILESYLPAQMSEEEVKKLVAEAVAQTGATSAQEMGKVMGALMPKVKGKADGGLVSKMVRESLAA